jgi:hypothetical protein
VAPGKASATDRVAQVDGRRIRGVAERVFDEEMAKVDQLASSTGLFQPKGQIGLDLLLFQSVLGPIGLPASEAVYPSIETTTGEPMNARHDYVIRMSRDSMPPAGPFWSITPYDKQNGFFIPNDRKKYSAGKNAGMKLNADGGIEIHIAARKPKGVPEENWLPVNRTDEPIDAVMRVDVPHLEKLKTWNAPKADIVT